MLPSRWIVARDPQMCAGVHLKKNGKTHKCRNVVQPGDEAWYDFATKQIYCETCSPRMANEYERRQRAQSSRGGKARWNGLTLRPAMG